MTDILDLDGWNVIAKHVDGDGYLIEAEYAVPPKACTKCGNIGNLYKHGPKPVYIRDSPIRGSPVRILAHAQRFKCRECGGTFIQPLGGIHQDSRMTSRCVEFIQTQCLRQTFLHIAELVGCDDKTVRNLAGKVKTQPVVVTPAEGKAEAIRDIQRRKRSMRAYLIAKFGNTCRSCGGVYEDKDLLAARTNGPYFDDKPEEGMELLCSGCYVRFHTERTSGHSATSTP